MECFLTELRGRHVCHLSVVRAHRGHVARAHGLEFGDVSKPASGSSSAHALQILSADLDSTLRAFGLRTLASLSAFTSHSDSLDASALILEFEFDLVVRG